ncbi:hypothetical protein [Methanoculleus chikugoensis]|uniref:hypothetical protein n=1 Tax=Methanoculleus chikugoensis TaxID=118126 RepID=UPI001FB2722D|nr:hypothetical protein [Methanoculleus chikugoensis]
MRGGYGDLCDGRESRKARRQRRDCGGEEERRDYRTFLCHLTTLPADEEEETQKRENSKRGTEPRHRPGEGLQFQVEIVRQVFKDELLPEGGA